MKEKIIAGFATSVKETSLVTAGFTAPMWMQMLNSYMGFLIGVFTLIYVVWRVLDSLPKMIDGFYQAKHKLDKNWAVRKEELEDFEAFKKQRGRK